MRFTSAVARPGKTKAKPSVRTLVGRGLFEWGDVDGMGDTASLQHPTGIAHADGIVFIADSYNHKIRKIALKAGGGEGDVTTWLGNGKAGDDLDHADEVHAGGGAAGEQAV